MALKKLGSTGRYGTRYGFGIKKRLLKIESVQKKSHKCPYCFKAGLKRVAAGIWFCKHCSSKFAAKAYSPETSI